MNQKTLDFIKHVTYFKDAHVDEVLLYVFYYEFHDFKFIRTVVTPVPTKSFIH